MMAIGMPRSGIATLDMSDAMLQRDAKVPGRKCADEPHSKQESFLFDMIRVDRRVYYMSRDEKRLEVK